MKNDASNSACLVCNKRPTIRAHLLPESFVREIFHKPKADEKHMIFHPETGVKQQSNTGRFERGILCAECDGVLGRYEDSAFRLIKRLRAISIGRKNGTQSIINEGIYPFRVAVIDEFVRFACAILWKYSSTPIASHSISRLVSAERCSKTSAGTAPPYLRGWTSS